MKSKIGTFASQRIVEFKKPGKIYCSTFRGHRDSIIKRLVKSYANKEKYKISNSNWTEWSTIQGVIARVISKSDEREARGRLEITSTITP